MRKITKSKISPPKKTSTNINNTSMETSEIRDLIDFISKSNLNSVEIETNELKLRIVRESKTKYINTPVASDSYVNLPKVSEPPKSSENKTPDSQAETKNIKIKSPMIGTFYRAPNPDSPPLISLGDKVKKGQIVCIIEAMKLFNEIESEVSGTVVQALTENATPVEYDQVLFLVEPD